MLELNRNELIKSSVAPLLDWYRKNKRDLPWRKNRDPYRIWISEIMLQQTRVEAVIPYYERFLTQFPTVFDLAQAPQQQVLKLWEGLGYYSRAKNLQKTAQVICEQYNGVFPKEYKAILALPGIGDYTAGAILSIAFEQPVPAVDGNVLRVIARLTGDDRDIADPKLKKVIASELAVLYPNGQCGDFTQGLMELGATVCVPNGEPRCVDCPWKNFCVAKNSGRLHELPVKSAKAARKIEFRTVLLLCDAAGNCAIHQRLEKGLLAGMWEFPSIESELISDESALSSELQGIEILAAHPLPSAKHIFTHVEWRLQGILVTLQTIRPPIDGMIWASREEILSKYAIPNAFSAYKEIYLEEIQNSMQ